MINLLSNLGPSLRTAKTRKVPQVCTILILALGLQKQADPCVLGQPGLYRQLQGSHGYRESMSKRETGKEQSSLLIEITSKLLNTMCTLHPACTYCPGTGAVAQAGLKLAGQSSCL